MIPSVHEVAYSLGGAWRLFLRDARGLSLFNITIEGFWHSFFAILLGVPFFFFARIVGIEIAETIGTEQPIPNVMSLRFWLPEMLLYACLWISFPIIMSDVVKKIHRKHLYATYIIAYNWTMLFGTILFALPSVFYVMGLMGPAGTAYSTLVMMAVSLFYFYFVTRIALETSAAMAFLILVAYLTTIILLRTMSLMAQGL